MKKNNQKIKLIITIFVIVFLLWFIIINPLLKFKSMEKELVDSTKRYFEINSNMLPTGNKIRKVSLQTLYDKDFIKEDLRAPYTNKYCNTDSSWVRVSKASDGYKYDAYLECGIFKSKTDHNGPVITLNDEDSITIYQGNKYSEKGVKSVIDDTDGKIDVNNVKIDSSKVDTNKVGTYEVTYTISDSLDNQTVKTRVIKVIQTLNNIVSKNTDKTKIYKGSHTDNYVMLDGILFKIVGINSDKSVKIVSTDSLASVNYEGIESWLNNYFYKKLSDSAKEYIVKSKWCNEKVDDPTNYTKCNSYGKKNYVGLLSVADLNNSKNGENTSNISNQIAIWTSNTKSDKESWLNSYFNMNEGGLKEYKEINKDEIYSVKPVLNIKNDSLISSGDGTQTNPYILKDNNNTHKKGDKISELKTGTYLSYSGYKWRVIETLEDGTTKVIMMDSLGNGNYYTTYDKNSSNYNPNRKTNLGYKIVNESSEYIKTTLFTKKNIEIKTYDNGIKYGKETSKKNYSLKFVEASIFDLYSAQPSTKSSVWYQESSKKGNINYSNSMTLGIVKTKFDSEYSNSVRLVGYINKEAVIKDGAGTEYSPYTLTK